MIVTILHIYIYTYMEFVLKLGTPQFQWILIVVHIKLPFYDILWVYLIFRQTPAYDII